MKDLKNEEITELANKILDGPSDVILNDMLSDLTDRLSGCEVFRMMKLFF